MGPGFSKRGYAHGAPAERLSMSDEAQAPLGEQPGTDDTPDGTVAEQVDWEAKAREWEQRYQNLQPEYTRTTQELSQARQLQQDLQSDDPSARARAVEALGLQLVNDEDDEYADPTDALVKRLEAVEARYEADRQRQAEEAHVAKVEALIEQQTTDLGLNKATKDWVVSRALALPFTDQNMPNIKAAYDEFEALQTELKKQWKETKRAPHVSSVGTSATQQPNLDSDRERRDWMKHRLAELNSA